MKLQGELGFIAGSLTAVADGLIRLNQVQFELTSFDKNFALDGRNLGFEKFNENEKSWVSGLKNTSDNDHTVRYSTTKERVDITLLKFRSQYWLIPLGDCAETQVHINDAIKEMEKISTTLENGAEVKGSPKLISSLLGILDKQPSIFLCAAIHEISSLGLAANGKITLADKLCPIQR